jgi:hypothetical protein
MPRGLVALLIALSLAACAGREAPEDVGVCWRAHAGAGGAFSFTPLARNVANLETCAVLLEGLRLQGQADTDGAFQGYFIFVDEAAMSSARHVHGFRYPIFQPPQRAEVDRDLRRLMRERGGRMPDASELALERR